MDRLVSLHDLQLQTTALFQKLTVREVLTLFASLLATTLPPVNAQWVNLRVQAAWLIAMAGLAIHFLKWEAR
jgi:hypothetical protein